MPYPRSGTHPGGPGQDSKRKPQPPPLPPPAAGFQVPGPECCYCSRAVGWLAGARCVRACVPHVIPPFWKPSRAVGSFVCRSRGSGGGRWRMMINLVSGGEVGQNSQSPYLRRASAAAGKAQAKKGPGFWFIRKERDGDNDSSIARHRPPSTAEAPSVFCSVSSLSFYNLNLQPHARSFLLIPSLLFDHISYQTPITAAATASAAAASLRRPSPPARPSR
jgi:hypothetical protein